MDGAVKKFWLGVFMMSGMIIGVGFFALPYIAAQVGLSVILAYLFILTAVVIIIHQYYAEVALRTPDFLRLPSYVGIYLGKKTKVVALFISVIGFLGTLLAYIVIGGNFLSGLLSPFFGGSQFFYSFIYFAVGSLIVFFGVRAVSKMEFLDAVLFIIILAAVFIFGWKNFNVENLLIAGGTPDISNILFAIGQPGANNFFLPYGVVLFALWGGANIISEVEEILTPDKRALKKVVAWSIILPAIFYLLFILAVFGISGSATSPEAIAGLKNFLPTGVIALLFVFGLIATFTSYIVLSLILRNVLRYDLKIQKKLAWAVACFTPFLLYSAGLKDFIKIIGFVGAITLAIEGILIILMYREIKEGRVNFVPFVLIILLALGIVYEIIYFVK